MQIMTRLSQLLAPRVVTPLREGALNAPIEPAASLGPDALDHVDAAPQNHNIVALPFEPEHALAAPVARQAHTQAAKIDPPAHDVAKAEVSPAEIAGMLGRWLNEVGTPTNSQELHLIAHSLCAVALHDDIQRFFAGNLSIDDLQSRAQATVDAFTHVMNNQRGLNWTPPALPSFEEAFAADDERLYDEARAAVKPSAWKNVAARTAGMAMGAPFGVYAMFLGGHLAAHLQSRVAGEPQNFRRTAVRVAGLSVGAAMGGPGAMVVAQNLAGELDSRVSQLSKPLEMLKARASELMATLRSHLPRKEPDAPLFFNDQDDEDAHAMREWEIVDAAELFRKD